MLSPPEGHYPRLTCCRNRQRGLFTLAISLVILMLSTLITFNLAKAILMEQKIASNEARARQAYEAAEAGINRALDYLGGNPDRNGDGSIDPVFDTNADGIGDSDTAAIGPARIQVTTSDLTGMLRSIAITSRGFSDDNSVTRSIRLSTRGVNPLPGAPLNPVVIRGSMTITGAVNVNNHEGHSTLWSGGDIELGSNNTSATKIPNIGDAGYPACMTVAMSCALVNASNRLLIGPDVLENDSSLGSLKPAEFFRNFFGLPPETYRSAMVTITTTPTDFATQAHLAGYEVIWVEGNIIANGVTVGCAIVLSGNLACADIDTKPSIIIINGNAAFGGNMHLYGMLYVAGNFLLEGNFTMHGGMLIGGDLTNTAGSTLAVWYNSKVLEETARAGRITIAPGSWQDF